MKPLKKLQPVFSRKIQETNPYEKMEQHMKMMTKCMVELANQITKFTSQSQKFLNVSRAYQRSESEFDQSKIFQTEEKQSHSIKNHTNRKQSRFQNVKIPFTKIQKKDKQKRTNEIMKWFGRVCKQVLSVGFFMFQSQEPEVNKIKSYCSENILRNLLEFSLQNKLTPEEFSTINQSLCNQILPYFCLKYPETQEEGVNLTFANELLQKNTIQQNSNDLVYKSGIKFKIEESGNYNTQIMDFLNYLIRLPGKMINQKTDENKQPITIADKFIKDVQTLFRKIQVQTNTINMKKFDPKNPSKIINIIEDKQSQKQKQAYLEKVKSYTSFQIGRKLSQNFREFTEIQMKSGILKLTNSGIMRIVTKWCEQLWNCFNEQYIMERENQFRMKDGSQKFMRKYFIYVLNLLLQRQKKVILQSLKEIQQNNYQQQSFFAQQTVSQKLSRFSQDEAIVGQFTSVMFKNYENYIINYLNLLIHGINKASESFQKFVRRQNQIRLFDHECLSRFENGDLDLEFIDKMIKQANDKSQNLSQVPQLITFKIGDLLRSKCSSKQSQIIAIYKQLQRLSYTIPNQIKIVRVKNRLDKGSKDILINAMYKQTMLVEIQLSIKAEKSKFISQSNTFNHYLYELRRAQFGPISEMCSIWMNRDLRSSFYLNQLEKQNARKTVKNQERSNQKQCCSNKLNFKIIRLPFICDTCKCFYFDCSFTQKHIACKICSKKTCFLCQIQSLPIKQKYQLIPQIKFSSQINLENIKFLTELPQKGGALLNIKSKIRKTRIFKTIYFNNEYYIFQNINQKKTDKQIRVRFIKSFKGKSLSSSFLKQNIMFTSPQIQSLIPEVSLQDALDQFFIPNYLKQSSKAHKTSIALIKIRLNEKIFSDGKSIWPAIKKLNFAENEFVNIDKLYTKFPYTRLAVLSFNKIEQISSEIYKWQNLKYLYLDNNRIKTINPNINKLKVLQELQLSHNQLRQLPNQFGELSKLRDLNLDCNHLQSLPEGFGKLQSLQKLNFANNCLKDLPESFGNLKCLKKLLFFHNPLEKLPESFAKLASLQMISGFSCKLKSLPESVGSLKNLIFVRLHSNSLQNLSQSFGQLTELEDLQLQYNNIQKLPDDLSGLKSLKKVDLYSNKISKIPESIGSLKSAKSIDLSRNKITQLPDTIGDLQNLELLGLSSNLLTEINKNICKLTELKTLQLDDNKIQRIPQEIHKLKNLRNVSFDANNLTDESIPQSLKALTHLVGIGISENKLHKFPEFLAEMSWLQKLNISDNQIKEIPPSVLALKNLVFFNIDKNKLTPQSRKTVQKIEQATKQSKPKANQQQEEKKNVEQLMNDEEF